MDALTRTERIDDAVAVLTLAHPDRRNALSIAMRDEICEHLEEFAADDRLQVVVIAAEGPVFCAGFDLREFERAATDAEFATTLWASSDRYHRAVATFPLITVAAIDGPAVAGGFDLALLCDLRVASTATWFAHPERTFGQVVYGPLHDLVGGAVARDLVLTGRRLDASEALALGLVSSVVDPGAARSAALALAATVAESPRAVLRQMKQKFLRRSGLTAGSATLDL